MQNHKKTKQQTKDDRQTAEKFSGLSSDMRKIKPIINLVLRTHDRPTYFRACIKSIIKQKYANLVLWVIADTPGSLDYVHRILMEEDISESLVCSIISIDPADVTEEFGDYNKLLLAGYCRGQRDFKKLPYDLYLNRVLKNIKDGWVMYVDDDKLLPTNILTRISKKLTRLDRVIIGQYEMKSRLLPTGEMWKKLPFTRAHIDMSCVVFHSSNKELAWLDGHAAGDWRMCNRLAGELNPIWMREPFTVADNDGNFGKSER